MAIELVGKTGSIAGSSPDRSEQTQERAQVDTTVASSGPILRRYLRAIGPGLVTGASDDDPSAIATYASAGARTGFGLLWTCLLTFPLMVAVQINSDRVALARGRSLGEVARERFTPLRRRLFLALLVVHLLTNVLVMAADLVAVGAGMNLLGAGPLWCWALAAGIGVSALLLSGSFATLARVLKILCIALLGYVAVLFVADVDWGDVLRHTVVPQVHLNSTFLALMVAVLGATLPPYVFFWQNVHRLEELRDEPEGGDDPVPLRRRARADAATKKRTSAIDVVCGMAFAVAVMFAVIVAVAITVQAGGPSTIASAADAARALEPVAGGMAKILFAVGFISAGILAIPVLAGSGAANVSGILGRDWGFSRSVEQAPVFYALVLGGTAVGTLLGLTGIQPIRLLVAAATMNGITAAPLLTVVMAVSGDRAVVGAHCPGPLLRVLGWAAVGVTGAATAALVLSAASTSSLS